MDAAETLLIDGTEHELAFLPFRGSQRNFLTCPAHEVLYTGTRGPGKTDCLLADFAADVKKGYGSYWRGVLFALRYKDLDDIVVKSERLYKRITPAARFVRSKSDYYWTWPTGERLSLRAAEQESDYWNFHGAEYPWIGFDELTKWADSGFYEQAMSLNRSSGPPQMRRVVRATTNPWGAGHGWVKDRWINRARPLEPIWDRESGLCRVYIHGTVHENKLLLEVDPFYIAKLEAIKNPELRRAWLYGDWTVNPGGFFSGVLKEHLHKVEPFPIPVHWTRWRALDWGTRRPFSIGWYAKSPEGITYRYRELYGWDGRPNHGCRKSATYVAELVKRIEAKEHKAGIVFRKNPADTGIWADIGIERAGRQLTVARQFSDAGVRWNQAIKGKGSRVSGWSVVHDLLEQERFKVFSNCRHWWRTIPSLEPAEHDWEDIDTDGEDHAADETRYALVAHEPRPKKPKKRPDPNASPKITLDLLEQLAKQGAA